MIIKQHIANPTCLIMLEIHIRLNQNQLHQA